jgi:predicted anti-sigma-YlaC factor YlaD
MATGLTRQNVWRALGLVLAGVLVTGCGAIKGAAINSVASTLAETGTTFSSDDDLELVGDAVPFALKFYESILESAPNHQDLLRATCGAFTQYAYAYVQTEAEMLPSSEYEAATAKKARALKLFLRGQGYCLRALELRRKGVTAALQMNPDTALGWAQRKDVPLLYWTGAAWGSAISLGLDRPELVADSSAVKALIQRALALNEGYEAGALHGVMISLESVPEAMGGSKERARKHFDRAVELSKGLDPGPYVTFASSISVATGNKTEFVKLLETAIAIDPDQNRATRLATLVNQKRARHLLSRVDELFVDGPSPLWSH